MIRAYLDNNATTRPYPEVVQAMMPYFTEAYLNVSSAAAQFLGLDRGVADAKREIGKLLGSTDSAREIVFTSGASEANSWALKGHSIGAYDQIVSTTVEHPSVLAALSALERRGSELRLVGVTRDGLIEEEDFRGALSANTSLVSVMLANNETGVIQPVARIAQMVREAAPNCVIHCDVTQAVGRIPIDLEDELFEVDLASFSGHKFHGPKGVGGLFIRSGTALEPLMDGEHENGRRGGTLNSPGIAGMAAAARIALRRLQEMEQVRKLRDFLEGCLLTRFPDARVNGIGAPRLPNTTSIVLPGWEANTLVDVLASRGICVATGSACSSGSDAPSHVLTAMGLGYEDALQTVRISLSHETTQDEVEVLLSEIDALRTNSFLG